MMDKNKVEAGGLIYKDHIGMVGLIAIPTHPGIGGRYFSELADAGIHVELIVNLYDGDKYDHILVCVDRNHLEAAVAITEKIHKEVDSHAVIHDDQVALVCISSLDFDESQVIAGHMFRALGDSGINIQGISTSVSSVTCMISSQDLDKALTVLRQAFILP
ncbi:MAG: ACT domain-containing protein [Brevefilum sp.]|nr:ACT domain-containing protein [Brevefilum sp.]MDT8381466.1 ACT domain-containing protein [Brevefilum sp.]MDW7753668.1 ACT domain-containing protein [Brevefilum sp.]